MATYYVATTGSDSSGSGAIGSPWKTIEKALTQVSSGDTVLFRGGTYYPVGMQKLDVTNTTWKAYTGETPIFDGRYGPTESGWTGKKVTVSPHQLSNSQPVNSGNHAGFQTPMFRVEANGVTVDGLTVRNVAGSGIDVVADNTTVKNCTVSFVFGACDINGPISGSGTTDNVLWDNNSLSYTSLAKSDAYGKANYPAQMGGGSEGQLGNTGGLSVHDATDVVISNSTFAYGFGEGVTAGRFSDRVTVEDCVIYDFAHVLLYVSNCTRATFKNNLVFHTGAATWADPDRPSCIVIGDEAGRNNNASNESRWQVVYNNIAFGGSKIFEMRNNVDNYDTLLLYAYIGFNTFSGGYFSATDNSHGTSVTCVLKERIFVKDSTGASSHWNTGNHRNSVFENNIILKGVANKLSVANGSMGSILFRNNLWSELPVAALRGTNDETGNDKLAAPNYQVPPAYPALFTSGQITTIRNRFQISNSSSGAINAAVAFASSVNGMAPPNVTTDHWGAARGSGGNRDIGAHEYGGTISNQLDASFTQSATTGTAPLSVAFTDTSDSTGGTVNGWLWDFGDGTSSTSQNPSHTYASPGVYTPALIASDSNGLQATYTGSVITVTAPDGGSGTGAGGSYDWKLFTVNTSTGNQDISFANLNGQVPKAGIFIMSAATALDTVTNDAMMSVGFSDGPRSRCQVIHAADAQAAAKTHSRWLYRAMASIDNAGDVTGAARVVGFSADTITIEVLDAFPSAYYCLAIALCGDDLQADVAQTVPTSVGTPIPIGWRGAPFNVDGLIALGGLGGYDVGETDAAVSIGVADSAAQYAAAIRDRHGYDPTVLSSWLSENGRIARKWFNAQVSLQGMGTSSLSMTAEENAYGDSIQHMALRTGGGIAVKQYVIPAATGTVAYAAGFEPGMALLFGSATPAAGQVYYSNSDNSVLWAAVATANGTACVNFISEDNAATSNTASYIDDQLKVYIGGNSADWAGTITLTSTGMNVNVTDAPAGPVVFNVMFLEAGTVTDEDDPVVDFTVSPTQGYLSDIYALTNLTNANGNTITLYAVDWGDGETTTDTDTDAQTHVYYQPGIYTITLTATTAGGDFTKTRAAYVSVANDTQVDVRVLGAPYPYPGGVTNYTPNKLFEDSLTDPDLGYISHALDLDGVNIDIDPEDTTTPAPGKIRILHDVATGELILIRADGATSSIALTWIGGGGDDGDSPPDAPTLNAISNGDGDGDYTVSWGAVTGADSYVLQESYNGGAYAQIYAGAGTSHNVTGNADGSYTYRAKTIDGALESAWSSTTGTTVSTSSGGTVEISVSTGVDDGDQEEGNGSIDRTGSTITINELNDMALARFNNVTVPQGATIDSATIEVYVTSTAYDDPNVRFYCENADDSAGLTTTTSNISSRSRTSAYTSYSGTGVGTGWKSIDITTAVQEVVERGGWSSGNDMSVIWVGQASAEFRVRSYEGDSAQAAKITIEYS